MDFFKSVFSEEPEDDDSGSEEASVSSSDLQPEPQYDSPPGVPDANPNIPAITNAWTFGSGLLKTLASKLESVIQNYRRDLENFSSGLQKETAIVRKAASRAVKDLPSHIESGAAVAQESLETVGQAIDKGLEIDNGIDFQGFRESFITAVWSLIQRQNSSRCVKHSPEGLSTFGRGIR